MAIEKFRFVSPGVQINEIDDSVIAPTPPAVGPVVIGRTAKGPSMQPVLVNTVGELEKVFGGAANGAIGGGDVWRAGTQTSPTIATYAARAFLRNSSPVTVIRLAGIAAGAGQSGDAGWSVDRAWGLFAITGSTAKLASVIYANSAKTIEISASGGYAAEATASLSSGNFMLRVGSDYFTASLSSTSTGFLRKTLNVNPTRYSAEGYFLGETFENSLGSFDKVGLFRLGLGFTDYTEAHSEAETGWVISDHSNASAADATNLFKLIGLNGGANTSRDIKISIENVRASKNTSVTQYGTFDVVIRPLFEPTSGPIALERFNGVNLDPTSENYIAKRIGDSYRAWSVTNQRYEEFGSYPNRSVYVYVHMNETDSIPATALPHGFLAVARPTIVTNNATALSTLGLTGSHPDVTLFTTELSASTAKTKRFGLVSHPTDNLDLLDILRLKTVTGSSDVVVSTRFINSGSTGNESGSRYIQGTYNSTDFLTSGRVLGFDLPIYGGFDGSDITQVEPFINEDVLGSQSENVGYAYRSIKAAIDIVANPETTDMNVLCIPGLKDSRLTSYMIDVCKARGDAMAIIDLPGDYKYAYEAGGTASLPSNVTSVVSSLEARAIDSSYGAAYFPAVFVQSEGIYLPASVAALGAFGGTEGRSALWFAPAGFNRGGLTEGNSGIGVSRTALQLTATDRDTLYEANINPIASFPNEGVLIFGQKTLQQTPSALDRVNVRRLLNFIKKEISRAATRILFEPNVETTWNNFKAVVEPFLQSIKDGFGLDDARIILDASTTTADLVDRNTLYAKILLKPTRAIEYIALDFVVTNSGASFTE
jgi:hypothetical protein